MNFGYKKYANSNTYSNASGICWVRYPFDSYKRLQCDEMRDAEKVAEQMLKDSNSQTKYVGTPFKGNDSDSGDVRPTPVNPFVGATSTKYSSDHKLTQKEIDSFKQYSDKELAELLSAVNMAIDSNTEFLGMTVAQLKTAAPIIMAEYNRRNLSQSGFSDKQKLAAATLAKITAEAKYKESVKAVGEAKTKRVALNTTLWIGGTILVVAVGIFIVKKIRKNKAA